MLKGFIEFVLMFVLSRSFAVEIRQNFNFNPKCNVTITDGFLEKPLISSSITLWNPEVDFSITAANFTKRVLPANTFRLIVAANMYNTTITLDCDVITKSAEVILKGAIKLRHCEDALKLGALEVDHQVIIFSPQKISTANLIITGNQLMRYEVCKILTTSIQIESLDSIATPCLIDNECYSKRQIFEGLSACVYCDDRRDDGVFARTRKCKDSNLLSDEKYAAIVRENMRTTELPTTELTTERLSVFNISDNVNETYGTPSPGSGLGGHIWIIVLVSCVILICVVIIILVAIRRAKKSSQKNNIRESEVPLESSTDRPT